MMSDLGLDPWGVRHGLATKLVLRSLDGPVPTGVTKGSPQYGGEFFDVARSLQLYQDVYQYRGIKDRPIWQDRSTLNIPFMFYALALQLSDVAGLEAEDDEVVARLRNDALAFQLVADGGVRGSPDG